MPLKFDSPRGDIDAWLDDVGEQVSALIFRKLDKIAREAADLYYDSLTASGDYGVFDIVPIQWQSFVNGELVDTFAGIHTNGSVSTFFTTSAPITTDVAFQWAAVVNRDAVDYARTMPNRMKDVGDHLWNDLTTKISSGLESGDVRDRLRKVVQEVGQFSRYRAELIARTETTRAFNAGSLGGARALGSFGPVEKSWISGGADGVTRDSHIIANGQTVGINEMFALMNGQLDHPGADGPPEEVCNCRCSLLYLYPGDTRPDGSVVPDTPTPSGIEMPDAFGGDVTEALIEEAQPDPMRGLTSVPAKINAARHADDFFRTRFTKQWWDEASGGRGFFESIDTNDAYLRAIMRDQGFNARPTVVTAAKFDDLAEEGWTVVHRGVTADNPSDLRGYVRNFLVDDDPYVGRGLHGNGVYTSTIRETAEEYASTKGLGIGSREGPAAANNGVVMDIAIHPTARVIDSEDLAALARRRVDELREQSNELDARWPTREVPSPYSAGETMRERIPLEELFAANPNDQFAIEATRIQNYKNLVDNADDVGKLAAMEGYDVIRVVNPRAWNDQFQIIELPDTYYVILNRGAIAVKEVDL
jgi:hypothetical protein